MTNLPAHLFVSSDNGALYDTRVIGWHAMPPLRANYRRGEHAIATMADLKAVLRHGPYAWPGGYPLYFLCSDGEALSFATVRANLRNIMPAIQNNEHWTGWRVVAIDVNWEDQDLFDAHTSERIESAYGENDTESDDNSEES